MRTGSSKKNLNEITKDNSKIFFSKKNIDYSNEIPPKSIIKRKWNLKKAKNDFLRSFHNKIVEITTNNNIRISNYNLNLLDYDANINFTNKGISGDFQNTPIPQPNITLNHKDISKVIINKIKTTENSTSRKFNSKPLAQANHIPSLLEELLNSRKLDK